MLIAAVEDRFRARIGIPVGSEHDESITFAVEFTQLLARILRDEDITFHAREAMSRAIETRTILGESHISILLDLALAPENRVAISQDDLRAFGSRFGEAEAAALHASTASELDLGTFAEKYGSGEGLLLLDALFSVCAVDGRIDRDEIRHLTDAAEELGIDQSLIGALFRKHDARHAAGEFVIELDRPKYIIGRATHFDIPLPDAQVAMKHASVVQTRTGWRVVDLGSGRPTLLNGVPIKTAPFTPGDQLKVGSYTLVLGPEGKRLAVYGKDSFSALSVRGLKRKIRKAVLLDDVSFTVFTGEVIAVVGPSGAGKTTLLNAIAGIAPADKGQVIFDRQNFHRMLAADRSIVGIVPQDDVVHPELTVEESLWYSGRLRFPSDARRETIQGEVNRVLTELDIDHIRHSRVGDAVRRGISGGQRKRVNLGQELLTTTTRVLFLDEPTSGLDPQTSQDIVSLIRQLADDGRIVFLVTHDMTPSIMSQVDHLMVLAPGGRLAWFGPPNEGANYFGVGNADEIFSKLAEHPPEHWGNEYKNSTAFRKYVATREHLLGLDGVDVVEGKPKHRRRSFFRTYFTLTFRYFRVKRRDLGGLFVLLSQAPILGIFMYFVFPGPDAAAMFMLALSSLWFGASASVRELIAERPIWRREARVGLGSIPYVLSKVTVLGAIVGLQCTMLTTLCFLFLPMWGEYNYSWFLITFVSALTGWIGMVIGLWLSAAMASSEAAVGALPLVLIPQITFSGLLVKVKEMGFLAKTFSSLMIVRYSFDALIKTGDKLSTPTTRGALERPIKPIGGILYELGFKESASPSDMGYPLWLLILMLMGIFSFVLLMTFARTSATRHGN